MSDHKHNAAALIATLGVVYGDIGTSPLYALKSTFSITGLEPTYTNVMGITSIFIWILIIVVMYKYVSIVLHFDNRGEGGILALSALCNKMKSIKNKKILSALAIIGAALFYGDGVITPSISILSAVEGLDVLSPMFNDYIIAIALAVIFLVFYIQNHGSGTIGNYFGAVMLVWFGALAYFGILQIIKYPKVIEAILPLHAVLFIIDHPATFLLAIGGAILVVTGAEALYADMGHFGRHAIIKTWTMIVLPSLILNYLGQAALVIQSPIALENPFYLMIPQEILMEMIILATLATVIASQAIISGVFSMTWQGVMLNYIPRLKVKHTSYSQIGQVYIPTINKMLFVATVLAVLIFRSSDNLAHAYGLSVAGMMLITTVLVISLLKYRYDWSWGKISFYLSIIVIIDIIFVLTNLAKIKEGAWFTIIIGLCVWYVIHVWQRGNTLAKKVYKSNTPLKILLEDQLTKYTTRIPGTAVFMSRFVGQIPYCFAVHLKHNKFLHEKILFLTFSSSLRPRVHPNKRFAVTDFGHNVYGINVTYGFKENPDMTKVVKSLTKLGLIDDTKRLSYFLSRGIPVASHSKKLDRISEVLYVYLSRNANAAHEFYNIPNEQLIELGLRFKV